MSPADILEQIRSMDPAERRELFEQVATEFPAEIPLADDDPTPEQIAEFERRAEEARLHPETTIPWEQVRAELRQKYGWK